MYLIFSFNFSKYNFLLPYLVAYLICFHVWVCSVLFSKAKDEKQNNNHTPHVHYLCFCRVSCALNIDRYK